MVALALLFTVAAGAVSQLRLSSHASNACQAKMLAEAAIATTVASLRQDLRFGETAGLGEGAPAAEVVVRQGQATGVLSFLPDVAERLEIPVSLNNVNSDAPEEGWGGRVIPPEAVQLVAVGSCGGVRRTVEAVLHVPRFPYVVSSSGDFSSAGPLVLGVLPEGAEPSNFNPDDLLPGHLASNASVQLQGDALISGDVEAVETISVVEPSKVCGLVRPNSSPVPLARLRVTDYQPMAAITETFTGSTSHTKLAGFYQGSGLVTADGGLDLEGAVLYIDGDLRVNGAVTGKGAVICTGTITVNGTMVLQADQQVALLAQGDVTLNGQGAFSGLVYTEGDLRSTGVQLIGALIANSDTGGAVELRDTGAMVGVPNLNFDEGWLYEPLAGQATLPWIGGFGPGLARVDRRGKVIAEGDHFVIEWTFESAPPSALAQPMMGAGFLARVRETLGPFPTVREIYNSDGQRVSSNYDEVWPPYLDRYRQMLSEELQILNEDGSTIAATQSQGTDFSPPEVAPTRVLADPVLQTFKLDFNQFLKAEENLRLLLRVDH